MTRKNTETILNALDALSIITDEIRMVKRDTNCLREIGLHPDENYAPIGYSASSILLPKPKTIFSIANKRFSSRSPAYCAPALK